MPAGDRRSAEHEQHDHDEHPGDSTAGMMMPRCRGVVSPVANPHTSHLAPRPVHSDEVAAAAA